MVPAARREGDVLVIAVADPVVDEGASDRLADSLRELVAGEAKVVLDLSAVRYLDLFGFEALLTGVSACPGKCRWAGLSADVFHLLCCHQLHHCLSVHSAAADAVAAFGGA